MTGWPKRSSSVTSTASPPRRAIDSLEAHATKSRHPGRVEPRIVVAEIIRMASGAPEFRGVQRMIDPPPPPAATGRAGRVLVLILAYNAERHICGVLERIPGALLNSGEVHFLVLDDASDDAGVEAALRWVARHDVTNVTVLRNGVNQGYGGNQKLGYRLALDCSFDFAVLLHGDGQYS